MTKPLTAASTKFARDEEGRFAGGVRPAAVACRRGLRRGHHHARHLHLHHVQLLAFLIVLLVGAVGMLVVGMGRLFTRLLGSGDTIPKMGTL